MDWLRRLLGVEEISSLRAEVGDMRGQIADSDSYAQAALKEVREQAKNQKKWHESIHG